MSTEAMASPVSPVRPEYVMAVYNQVCRSHQALYDFRMKLLGLLPIASVAALLALGKSVSSQPSPTSGEGMVIGYIGIFSALFTLALFLYEARGILMCHDLYYTGAELEDLMRVSAQFKQCDEMRKLPCYNTAFKKRLATKINDKIASSAIYSLVFAAWLFVALKFVFGVHPRNCAMSASIVGVLLTCISTFVLHRMTAEPKPPKPMGGANAEYA